MTSNFIFLGEQKNQESSLSLHSKQHRILKTRQVLNWKRGLEFQACIIAASVTVDLNYGLLKVYTKFI